MSSTSIYQHNPYFYIIKHIPSRKLYGGAKWGNDANPDTFMTPTGYQTSSNTIKKLIEKDGLNSFKTVMIIPESECFMSVYEYETVFLQSNDIANNDKWLNRHNNDGYFDIMFDSEDFKSYMYMRYGVENCMQSEEIRLKSQKTLFANYGVQYPLQATTIRNTFETTMVEMYGSKHALQSKEIYSKLLNTMRNEHGVDNAFQLESVKIKSKYTMLQKCGVDNPSKLKENADKIKKRRTGSSFWNDGTNTFVVKCGDNPEQNWTRGMASRKEITKA